MDEISIQEKINSFLENKNIDNSFIRECVTEFVYSHTEIFGDVISVDNLFARLEENLDKITFAGKRKELNELGEYKGRIQDNVDQNEILLYADLSDLEISEEDQKFWNMYTNEDKQKLLQERDKRREEIKSTLLHELTHAAYTIKGEYGIGEKHIFSESGRNLFGADYYSFIGGNNNYVEAIVNYISARIEGKSKEEVTTYKYETEAIYMLAEKVSEKEIVQSAWDSNEQMLEQCITDEKINYEEFNDSMNRIVSIRNSSYDDINKSTKSREILERISKIIEGKETEKSLGEFKEFTNHPIKENENGKNALEDVSDSNIRRGLFDRAISFIKEKINIIQEKSKETNNDDKEI